MLICVDDTGTDYGEALTNTVRQLSILMFNILWQLDIFIKNIVALLNLPYGNP